MPVTSMKYMVLLFNHGMLTNSEKCLHPNLDSVEVDLGETLNVAYFKGLQRDRFYHEAKNVFLNIGKDILEMAKFR